MTDDLLQPSLSSADDRQGFQNPWNPRNLMWVAVFGGVLASGALVVHNERRLGIQNRIKWLIPLILVIWIATMYLTISTDVMDPGDDGFSLALGRNFRMFNRVIGLVMAWVLLIPQRRRFEIFETGDEEPASLWRPAIAAAVVSSALQIAIFYILSTSV